MQIMITSLPARCAVRSHHNLHERNLNLRTNQMTSRSLALFTHHLKWRPCLRIAHWYNCKLVYSILSDLFIFLRCFRWKFWFLNPLPTGTGWYPVLSLWELENSVVKGLTEHDLHRTTQIIYDLHRFLPFCFFLGGRCKVNIFE